MLFLNIIYVLLAIAMIVLILMQRGAGAAAGSGFGGGASGTVFGARGSSSFLSKATKWMAIAFFVLSMFMAYQATQNLRGGEGPNLDLGVMSQVPTTPAQPQAVPAVPTQVAPVPQADSAVPLVPARESESSAQPASPPQDSPQAPATGD